MKKVNWSNYKSKYDQQNKIDITIPKDLSLYKKNGDYKDVDTWSFVFKVFSQEQMIALAMQSEEMGLDNAKDRLKSIISIFLENVVDWNNVKLKDIIRDFDGDEEDGSVEVEFDKDALDSLLAEHFHLIPAFVQEVNDKIEEKRKRIDNQKKT